METFTPSNEPLPILDIAAEQERLAKIAAVIASIKPVAERLRRQYEG